MAKEKKVMTAEDYLIQPRTPDQIKESWRLKRIEMDEKKENDPYQHNFNGRREVGAPKPDNEPEL